MNIYIYAGAGTIVLIIIFLISNRFIHREKHINSKLNHFIETKDYIKAIELAQKLLAMYKKRPENHFILADIYLKANMKPKAIAIYKNMLGEKIFSSKIKEYHIREKLAEISLLDGKIADAFSELYMICKLNPDAGDAFNTIGKIYGSQKKYERAIEFIKKAIHLEPENGEYHYQLGLAYLDSGNLNKALPELELAVKYTPDHIKAQYFLALAYKQNGMTEKANALINKLNLKASQLPPNILRIGIMMQKMPTFEIDALEKNLEHEYGDIQSRTKNYKAVKSIDDLFQSGTEAFHNVAISIINKAGYIIKKETKTQLTDSSVEVNFIAVARKDKDNPNASPYFIAFMKTKSEIGTISYTNFLDKMSEVKAKNGVFIITSHFSPQIPEKAKKEKGNIVLIDKIKLARYL